MSQNLKNMKQIATYQAFHSAMQQVQSQEDNGEVEDFVGFDLLADSRKGCQETLCLDRPSLEKWMVEKFRRLP